MPRFAANLSLLFPEHPLPARVAAARRAGFAAVEVQFPYELPAVQWRAACDTAGLPMVLFNVPAGDLMSGGDGLACVPGREPLFAEALAQCADYARVLRPRCVNVLAGRVPAGVDPQACLAVLQDNLRRAVDVLAPLDVTVIVEAINRHGMPRFLVSTFDDMQALVASVPGTAMQFDLYHMARMGEPLAQHIAERGNTFGHVQFADVPGRHQPGTGTLDFATLFAALDASGYRGWCAAEYHPQGDAAASLHWLDRYRGGH
ncbi:MAG: hydroxypyruvate isomerase family protein [Gammaproteobacteria bacterium]